MFFNSYLDRIVGRLVSFNGAVISEVHDFSSPDAYLKVALYLTFHLSSKPSEALKSSRFNDDANSKALFLRITSEIGTLFAQVFWNQV